MQLHIKSTTSKHNTWKVIYDGCSYQYIKIYDISGCNFKPLKYIKHYQHAFALTAWKNYGIP